MKIFWSLFDNDEDDRKKYKFCVYKLRKKRQSQGNRKSVRLMEEVIDKAMG